MSNGNIGGIGNGGNNIGWSKKLAEELDTADGKKDGKISNSVWNGFIKKAGSNGNTIKSFINLNNAEKSFNYYNNKKDVGKVDWGNWKTMLNDFKAERAGQTEAPVQQNTNTQSTTAADNPVQQNTNTQSTTVADNTVQQNTNTQSTTAADNTVQQNTNTQSTTVADNTVQQNTNTQSRNVGDINGKFDEKITQGNTQDCYVIAGAESVLAKKGGKELLENKLNIDPNTGDATVKYGNKDIKVGVNEAQRANYLDFRGGDMRLIELAEDKDRKANGVKVRDKNGTSIDGGYTADFYKKIGLKNVKEEIVPIGESYNFNKLNDSNRAYQFATVGLLGEDGKPIKIDNPTAVKSNGKSTKIKDEHAYAVLGYKDGYVMLHDPNLTFDPNNPIGANTLYVRASDLQKRGFLITGGTIA